MILLPVHKTIVPRSGAAGRLLAVLVAVLTLSTTVCHSQAGPPAEAKWTPQVLVLVMGGMGASEQAFIGYDSVVPLPKAQADLDRVAALGRWTVFDAKGETKSSGGPKPKQTTSIGFRAKGMIDYAAGTLPIEPFIDSLKRFRYIEIDFIAPSSFTFKGLEDFENRFVKIDLDKQGNSYRYRVVIKDAGFSKLDLPLVQPVKPKPAEDSSRGRNVLLALALALAVGVVVYLAALYLTKRGNRDES